MRLMIVAACLFVAGCETDFLGYGPETCTTTPTDEQVKCCREVMYINPELEIVPLGYCIRPGLDATIFVKFVAKTDKPSKLFIREKVDATRFDLGFRRFVTEPKTAVSWWDVSSQRLTGASLIVKSPDSAGDCGLDVAYTHNPDGTMTVYAVWCET
jgi:hypothetical protein